jgi:hypothetical protein
MIDLIQLLGLPTVNHVLDGSKPCIHCKITKPLNEFPKKFDNYDGHDNRCFICKKKTERDKFKLKKDPSTPPMPTHCDICGIENPKGLKIPGRKTTSLALDHSYDDKGKPFFRGWICKKCNSGLGFLGDDIVGVLKAMNYLNKTLPKDQGWNAIKYLISTFPEEEHEKLVKDVIKDVKEREKNAGLI